MINSVSKRRNYSKELVYANKSIIPRQVSCIYTINTYQTNGGLRQRPLNRSSAILNTTQSTKKPQYYADNKFNQRIHILDEKFNTINQRIKSFFRGEELESRKQNNSPPELASSNPYDKRYQSIGRKFNSQCEESNASFKDNVALPYYIQCVRRKSIVSTEIRMHIYNSIQTFKQYLKSVQNLKARPIDHRIPPEIQNRKTIVFDMDETLIHTNDVLVKGYQLKVPFKTVQGRIISGYVCVRPYAKEIIKRLNQFFDIIIFTAGNQCYADPILDYIDQDRCIKHRLYRESCTMVNNQLFVKDLRILGRKLENVVLVDNAPYSYMLQIHNGVPILNYFKGEEDNQLSRLQEYLMSLREVDDVRRINYEVFRLSDYVRFEHHEQLIQQLYCKGG